MSGKKKLMAPNVATVYARVTDKAVGFIDGV